MVAPVSGVALDDMQIGWIFWDLNFLGIFWIDG
jgi:hypothetical protein